MKKFLAIAAVLALMLVMAVPALAADAAPSVTADDLVLSLSVSGEAPSAADIGSGNKLLGVYDAVLVHSATGAAATPEEAAAYIAAQGGALVIDFSSLAGDIEPVKVLHGIGGGWEPVAFSGARVTTGSLSPFAFIGKDAAADSGSHAAEKKASPQTGYSAVLWSIAAASMVLCAAGCFVRARKSKTE